MNGSFLCTSLFIFIFAEPTMDLFFDFVCSEFVCPVQQSAANNARGSRSAGTNCQVFKILSSVLHSFGGASEVAS
jgi:hypothetical protein